MGNCLAAPAAAAPPASGPSSSPAHQSACDGGSAKGSSSWPDQAETDKDSAWLCSGASGASTAPTTGSNSVIVGSEHSLPATELECAPASAAGSPSGTNSAAAAAPAHEGQPKVQPKTAPVTSPANDRAPAPRRNEPPAQPAPKEESPAAGANRAAISAFLDKAAAKPQTAALCRADTAKIDSFELAPPEAMGPINDSESQRDSHLGLPYRAANLGPPKPPCNAARLASLLERDALGDQLPDPQIEHIIQLACTVFGTENALVALLGGDRVLIRAGCGKFAPGDFPWRYSFCGYTLVPANPTAMVIEDAWADARFRNNAFVKSEPKVRFYCGTPILAADGHRLGTLCFADPFPRTFDAERVNILNNMAEMVAREIEREWAARLQRERSAQLQQLNLGLLRAVDCFQEALLFVDTAQPGWRLLHLNQAAMQRTGISLEAAKGVAFWDLFEAGPAETACGTPGSANASRSADERRARWEAAAAKGGPFSAPGLRVRKDAGAALASASSGAAHKVFTLKFRPANRDALDEHAQLIGVPSYMASAPGSGAQFFFAALTETMTFASGGSAGALAPTCTPFGDDLTLGPLLGKGGFGRVYRGTFRGEPVAVKIVEDARALCTGDGAPLEAVVTAGLRHEGIVATLAYAICSPATTTQPGPPTYLHDSAGSATHARVATAAGDAFVKRAGSEAPGEASGGSHGDAAAAGVGDDSAGSRAGKAGGMGTSGAAPRSRVLQARDQKGAPAGELHTWMILDYCDKGTLQEAIDKGWLRAKRSNVDGPPDWGAILAVAGQVAAGMAYLHAAGVAHGDLTGGNVLLASAPDAPQGFAAKVADFGLARQLGAQSRITTRTYGTVTHMAPEILLAGGLSRSADAYAFGVLLWEMAAGCRAWASMTHAQVIHAVAVVHRPLQLGPSVPLRYAALARQCMAHNPAARPTFVEIQEDVAALQAEMLAWGLLSEHGAPAQPSAPPSVAAVAVKG